jgi:hypothetical protein
MKKLAIVALLILPLVFSCAKEEEASDRLENKLEGNAGAMQDDYGLNDKELAQIQAIKNELIGEIKKGDSITSFSLRNEIDSLKLEIHKLKGKK